MASLELQDEAAVGKKHRKRTNWVIFVAFLVCNYILMASMYLLAVPGYISTETVSLGTSVATLSLILVAFGVIAVSSRRVGLKAFWPTLYTAAGLAFFARLLYFVFYPLGVWPGLWPTFPTEWERALTSSLVYAAEIILVAGFCRVMFALSDYLARLKDEQKRLQAEQAAHKLAQEQSHKLEQQLLQSQKMESIGRLAGGVAHDFNNMLTPILAYARMLETDFPANSPERADCREIIAAAERARDLTRQLLAFARRQALEIKPLNLNKVIIQFEKIIRSSLRENIDLNISLTAKANIAADRGQIEQVIMNLVLNAQDAMPAGGLITVKTSDVTIDHEYARQHQGVTPGSHVMLLVSDNGEGMDDETLQKIFEPFFTTKKLKQGYGLGLATTHGIVKQHRGSIWVYSEPGRGATFKIYFPATDAPEAAEPGSVAETAPACGAGTILVAEDNPQVRALAARILSTHGYTVLEAPDGKTAIETAQNHDGKLALLVSDVIMPDMNGKMLHEHLAQQRPGLKVLYMSGYSDAVIADHGILDSKVHFIEKPFSIEAFLAKVEQVIN